MLRLGQSVHNEEELIKIIMMLLRREMMRRATMLLVPPRLEMRALVVLPREGLMEIV
jgi:hypothetical protein